MKWDSERQLCAAFRQHVESEGGVTVYNESCGWDMLLVREFDGFQTGVQAKLKANLDVLWQVVNTRRQPKAPNEVAVLVPAWTASFQFLAGELEIVIIFPDESGGFRRMEPPPRKQFGIRTRCDLPPMVPEVPAGVPSPRKLTHWTMRELRLLYTLRTNGKGYLRTKDFQAVGLDPKRFMPSWLYRSAHNHFELVIESDTPDKHHPAAWAKVEEEMAARV